MRGGPGQRQSSKLIERDLLVDWISSYDFHRFVTLTFNDATAGNPMVTATKKKIAFLRDRLQKWDAMMNRKLGGPKWSEHISLRMLYFYMLEKPESNPHWHGLICFSCRDDADRQRQEVLFDRNAEPLWQKLVPSGEADVQPIYDRRTVVEYVVKTYPNVINKDYLIFPDTL